MSVAFYMDEHVPFAITAGLELRSVNVLTTQADGRQGTADGQILDRATELRRAVFTQDEDFLAEGHRRQQTGEAFAGVVYAHQLNVTIGQCVADLELIAKVFEPQDLANRVEYLPL
jgi:predicted nuclease of predicted toxin-antitoxin system